MIEEGLLKTITMPFELLANTSESLATTSRRNTDPSESTTQICVVLSLTSDPVYIIIGHSPALKRSCDFVVSRRVASVLTTDIYDQMGGYTPFLVMGAVISLISGALIFSLGAYPNWTQPLGVAESTNNH